VVGVYTYRRFLNTVSTIVGNNTAGTEGDAIYARHTSEFSPVAVYLRNTTITSIKRAPHAAVYLEGDGILLWFDTIITNHAVGVGRGSSSWIGGDYNAFFNNGVDQTVDGIE
jgi:hypothetical protein